MDATTTTKYIYKILPSAPPTPLPQTLPLSALDSADGFIHLSTSTQTPATASRFFGTTTTLWILKLQLAVFDASQGKGDILWEQAGDHGTFPHLYGGDLGRDTVSEVLRFERREGEDWSNVLAHLEA